MPASPLGIEFEHCATADDFLDALSPRDSRWSPTAGDWLFRGQKNASWALQPSAHRTHGPVFRYGREHQDCLPTQTPEFTQRQQLFQEAVPLGLFLRELDRARLPFPIQSQRYSTDEVIATLETPLANAPWPREDLAPLVALAQHHGIPTRFLDWSERAYFAAFFAAVDAARNTWPQDAPEPRVAVWGLNTGAVLRLLNSSPATAPFPQLQVVRVPRGANARLAAQEGVFSLIVDQADLDGPRYIAPPLDSLVEAKLTATDPGSTAIYLRCVTLPWSKAYQVLRILSEDFVSATQLFPGLDGVVASLRDRGYCYADAPQPKVIRRP